MIKIAIASFILSTIMMIVGNYEKSVIYSSFTIALIGQWWIDKRQK